MSSNSDSDSEDDKLKTPPKKIKRLCTYKKEWENSYSWLRQANKTDCSSSTSSTDAEAYAFCNLCKKSFSISHGGLHDVKRHTTRAEHTRQCRAVKSNQTLAAFLKRDPATDLQTDLVTAAEVTKVYHSIKHTHSFNSLDCESKLSSTIFPDSKIASKISLGRTKASSIAHNVLGPASIKQGIQYLREGVYYSLSTDASNHGNSKLFPLLLRYFDETEGIKLLLLDFFEDSNETALGIYNNLKQKLQAAGLDLLKISCYSADNASVNFGKHHSVYTLLKNDNNKLLPSGCPAHMIHNATKCGLDKSNFDLETLILKVYGHFSCHAKRVQELKEFFEFVDVEYKTVIRHVPTRWLTMYPAVDRLLRSYPAIKSYFVSLGENCPVALKHFFPEEYEGESVDGQQTTRTECYLSFYHNVLKLLYDVVLTLEKDDLLCSDVYFILQNLRSKLRQRINDKFVGFMCSNLLKSLKPTVQDAAMKDFMSFYQNVLNYIEARFDFSENNHLAKLQLFSLRSDTVTFPALQHIVENTVLNTHVNVDELYEEYCIIRDALAAAVQEPNKTALDKWTTIFKANPDLKNTLAIFQFVASTAVWMDGLLSCQGVQINSRFYRWRHTTGGNKRQAVINLTVI